MGRELQSLWFRLGYPLQEHLIGELAPCVPRLMVPGSLFLSGNEVQRAVSHQSDEFRQPVTFGLRHLASARHRQRETGDVRFPELASR